MDERITSEQAEKMLLLLQSIARSLARLANPALMADEKGDLVHTMPNGQRIYEGPIRETSNGS